MIEPTGSDADREWLLTNGLGGFAMGTVSGIPTRRYHGFLVTSMSPPVDRLLALHAVIDACHWNGISREANSKPPRQVAQWWHELPRDE